MIVMTTMPTFGMKATIKTMIMAAVATTIRVVAMVRCT